jgi:pyrimidine-specific ribonucleoside hydrolase
MTAPLSIAWDMETNDPDDVLTLCLLATHPLVDLVSVTVTPGSSQQVGLVRHILDRLEVQVPVGARSPGHPKAAVSDFHTSWLGKWSDAAPDGEGSDILVAAAQEHRGATLLTGAPLSNPGRALGKLQMGQVFFPIWVCQGGFAGDSVVPEPYRLEKFAGRETCPTFNLNGDPKAALALIETQAIARKIFVSKNVCHGVIYDQAMHDRVRPFRDSNPGLALMVDGMGHYLKHKPGKAFHDPLAACVAIEPSICTFRNVKLYREAGDWGSRLAPDWDRASMISIHLDRPAFERVLTAQS